MLGKYLIIQAFLVEFIEKKVLESLTENEKAKKKKKKSNKAKSTKMGKKILRSKKIKLLISTI